MDKLTTEQMSAKIMDIAIGQNLNEFLDASCKVIVTSLLSTEKENEFGEAWLSYSFAGVVQHLAASFRGLRDAQTSPDTQSETETQAQPASASNETTP